MGNIEILEALQKGNIKALARAISLVENEAAGYENILMTLRPRTTPVVGITGPPGAGKSTLTDALIAEMIKEGKKVAVLCIDPSSPFNQGALLGDRIRMSRWYVNENVYIRSLASRGSLGGLSSKIIEIADVVKEFPFDIILVETVGVGQSEIEIAGLADITIVVLVPEAGDEIQTMKAGLMEIADVFAVNKSDRPGSDIFLRNLRLMLAPAFSKTKVEIPVVKTVAAAQEGIGDLYSAIKQTINHPKNEERKNWLLTEKIYQLIETKRMKDIKKHSLKEKVVAALTKENFNKYAFANAIAQQQ